VGIARAARNHDVIVRALSTAYVAATPRSALMLGFSGYPCHVIPSAVARLARAFGRGKNAAHVLALLARFRRHFLGVAIRLEADDALRPEVEHRTLDHRGLLGHQRQRLALVQAFLVGIGQLLEGGAGAG
jgi:hypothetical protein